MTLPELVLVGLGALALLLAARRVWLFCIAAVDRAWLPGELKDAELVYSERSFRATRPLRLVARVDRAYRRLDGRIVLVELKTRTVARAYLSDVIELSAQRLALEAQTGERVDNCAYVVVQVNRHAAKIPRMVRLLAREEVIALAKRRDMILAGEVAPNCTRSTGLCVHCAFRRPCRRC